MVVEVVRKRREDIINSNRRGCDLIWAPNLVSKRGGVLMVYFWDVKSKRQQGGIQIGYG